MNETDWIDDEIVQTAKEKGIDIDAVSKDELETFRPQSALDRALDQMEEEMKR